MSMDSADLQKNYMDGYNKLMEAYRGSGIQQTVDAMNRAIRDSDKEMASKPEKKRKKE